LLNQHHRQEEPTVARPIIAAFVVIDTLMERLGHRSDVRVQVPDSEILTIAVVAAKYVGSHHERAAPMMRALGYLSGRISVSRFNRRLHQLADWMVWIPDVLEEVFTTGDVFIIDSLPLPVCRRVRARRSASTPTHQRTRWRIPISETLSARRWMLLTSCHRRSPSPHAPRSLH